MTVYLSSEDIEATDRFVQFAAKMWWLYLLAGIVSVLFGALVLSFEFETVWALAIFVGAYLIAWGIVQFVAAAARPDTPKWLYVLAGIVSIAVGVLALVWPGATLFVVSIFIGWLLVIWGIFDIVGSFFVTDQEYWWLYLIRGILAMVLGVWALAHPGLTLTVLVIVIGVMAVIFGITEIIASFLMRGIDVEWEHQKAELGLAAHAGASTTPEAAETATTPGGDAGNES